MVDFHSKISILIDRELKKSGEKEFARRRNRLVGEGVVSYGARTSEIRKIVRKYQKGFQELRITRDCFEIGRAHV